MPLDNALPAELKAGDSGQNWKLLIIDKKKIPTR
jgi:hypothetical protein